MTNTSVRIRQELLRLIEFLPGLHVREAARRAGISEPLALYHLNALEGQRLVRSSNDSAFRRFFLESGPVPPPADQAVLNLLRQPIPAAVVAALLKGPMTIQALTGRLRFARTTLLYHLEKLERAHVVTRAGGAWLLQQPERIERLCLAWPPPDDTVARFHGLWDQFYRRRERRK